MLLILSFFFWFAYYPRRWRCFRCFLLSRAPAFVDFVGVNRISRSSKGDHFRHLFKAPFFSDKFNRKQLIFIVRHRDRLSNMRIGDIMLLLAIQTVARPYRASDTAGRKVRTPTFLRKAKVKTVAANGRTAQAERCDQ